MGMPCPIQFASSVEVDYQLEQLLISTMRTGLTGGLTPFEKAKTNSYKII